MSIVMSKSTLPGVGELPGQQGDEQIPDTEETK
jgi:hypothetical protein